MRKRDSMEALWALACFGAGVVIGWLTAGDKKEG